MRRESINLSALNYFEVPPFLLKKQPPTGSKSQEETTKRSKVAFGLHLGGAFKV